MKVLDGEGVAIHTGPESCVRMSNHRYEALTGERTGQAIELRNPRPSRDGMTGVPTLLRVKRKATLDVPISRGTFGPCAVRDPAHVRIHLAWEPGDPTIHLQRLADRNGVPKGMSRR